MDLDDVADELYGLPIEEFTLTRNERAKQAKASGDLELAKRIQALQKPTTAAWLVNQLAREQADEIQPLLELGGGLREATANLSGEQLKQLGQQQHQLLHALVQQARKIAGAHGRKVSDDVARGVEDTLRAALADEAAGEQLAAGRLTDVLDPNGFPGGGAAVAARRPPAPPGKAAAKDKSSADDRRREELERAQRDLAEAEELARQTASDRADARTALDGADGAVEDKQREVADLRERLAAAEDDASRLQREQRTARKEYDRADRAARDAEQRRADARDRVEHLRKRPDGQADRHGKD